MAKPTAPRQLARLAPVRSSSSNGSEGDHITVNANDDYWGGQPTVDQIIWRVIPDASARYLALKAGDIHGMEQATPEDFEAAQADPELQVLFDAPLNTVYLAFNYKIKELQDPKVREAVAHAINKQALARGFLGRIRAGCQDPHPFQHVGL